MASSPLLFSPRGSRTATPLLPTTTRDSKTRARSSTLARSSTTRTLNHHHHPHTSKQQTTTRLKESTRASGFRVLIFSSLARLIRGVHVGHHLLRSGGDGRGVHDGRGRHHLLDDGLVDDGLGDLVDNGLGNLYYFF